MTKNKLKLEILKLVEKSHEIFNHFLAKEAPDLLDEERLKEIKKVKEYFIHQEYQNWYSQCVPLISTILPERLVEFTELYKSDIKRKDVTWRNFTIEDYLLGMVITRGGAKEFEPSTAFSPRFQSQITILESVTASLDSKLRDIESVLQAQIFDTELDASEELRKKGHLRAAGAVAGVVVEHHLASVCVTHGIKSKKKSPTISELNDALKDQNAIDIPMWRFIQRLGDIRNLCVHSKDRDPSEAEVTDLVGGAKKVITEVF